MLQQKVYVNVYSTVTFPFCFMINRCFVYVNPMEEDDFLSIAFALILEVSLLGRLFFNHFGTSN